VRVADGPLGRDAALAFARRVIPFGWNDRFDEVERDVFELEMLAGAEATCDAMEEAPAEALRARLASLWEKRAEESSRLRSQARAKTALRSTCLCRPDATSCAPR
jgi:hypothetical protein